LRPFLLFPSSLTRSLRDRVSILARTELQFANAHRGSVDVGDDLGRGAYSGRSIWAGRGKGSIGKVSSNTLVIMPETIEIIFDVIALLAMEMETLLVSMVIQRRPHLLGTYAVVPLRSGIQHEVTGFRGQ